MPKFRMEDIHQAFIMKCYTSAAERRQVPSFWRAELVGADVHVFFICNVREEEGTQTMSMVLVFAVTEVVRSPLVSYLGL